MNTLSYILIFSTIGSLISLAGGFLLLAKKGLAERISKYLASFAAGALLGAAFFDLLPEAQEHNGETNIFAWTLVGILAFFLLERFLHWFHHHEDNHASSRRPDVALIIVGDTVHNIIDGIAIAGTFMINIPLGIVTSLAVAAHEIPQEIGDFGLLLNRGVPRRKVIWINVFSAFATVVAAVLTYLAGNSFEQALSAFLAITAGLFIYIAVSDIIPEIHAHNRKSFAFLHTFMLLGGVGLIWATTTLLSHS